MSAAGINHAAAWAVGFALETYADGKGVTWVSQDSLSRELHLSSRTIRRGFAELKRAGLVELSQPKGRVLVRLCVIRVILNAESGRS